MRRVQHHKSKGTYAVLATGNMQTSVPISDYEPVTVYRSEADGSVWVRPTEEFEDGRFDDLPDADGPEDFPFLPKGFRWIGRPCRVTGGDYEYEGRLLFSFPKDIGGPIRYVVMDQNRRLFIHNSVQVGIEEQPLALDEAFFADFMAWNSQTFGPGPRTEGTIKHIKKELREIEADPTDPKEWTDIGFLSFQGFLRLGRTPRQLITGFLEKHRINKARKWPAWQDHPDTPIEHDRSGE
ncbi:dATP/dGTP pyrophosphohydrolase domain-containing protein [Rhizobium johnstonii]|uniref:dATP/dGTP pyrophosphohydrolase domain-containing protein n=1 Tax=Rhizobium johnstonii TaxID=3019933 RepID=UPI0013B9D5AC|nr:DUF550 domain-containing protein [Rhizobium leguminosarum]